MIQQKQHNITEAESPNQEAKVINTSTDSNKCMDISEKETNNPEFHNNNASNRHSTKYKSKTTHELGNQNHNKSSKSFT